MKQYIIPQKYKIQDNRIMRIETTKGKWKLIRPRLVGKHFTLRAQLVQGLCGKREHSKRKGIKERKE